MVAVAEFSPKVMIFVDPTAMPVLRRKYVSSIAASEIKKLWRDFIKSLAILNSRTVPDTSPEIIAKEMKRKKTTDISIAAPPFLLIFFKLFFIVSIFMKNFVVLIIASQNNCVVKILRPA